MTPRVLPIPCLSDNYAYLVHLQGSREAVVVDPSEEAPVLAALEREGLELRAILATHHHFDHVGGNEALVKRFPGIDVYCSEHDRDRVPAATRPLEDGAGFSVVGLEVRALLVPGHTLGALAYVIGDAVFTGDTLFVAGCGRLFEGTPAMMYTSLVETLGTLPAETRVYCGHEYTLANARFAATVEPESAAVKALLESALAAKARGEPTVPSSMGAERAHNPFVRAPELAGYKGESDPVLVLAQLRHDKNEFA